MTLRLEGSSSGFTEIDAPAAAGSNRLILPTSNGTANQFLKNGSTAGTLEFGGLGSLDRVKRTYGSEVTYSTGATAIEFTGISPNFSRLRLIMRGLSLSGTNSLQLEIGHAAGSGTYLTTGYSSFSNALTASSTVGQVNTTCFIVRMASAAVIVDGFIELYPDRATSPTRLYSNHALTNSGGSSSRFGAGISPDISAFTIDRIKLTPTGTNTFDNSANAALSLIEEVIE